MVNRSRQEMPGTATGLHSSEGNDRRRSRRRLFLVGLFLLLPLGTGLILALLILEPEPRVRQTSQPTVESALRARNLAKQVLACLGGQRESATISAVQEDLNALLTLVGRGERRFSGRVRVTPGIMSVSLSIRLPAIPIRRYLNLLVELLPDERGLNIERVKLGKLRLPRAVALAILRGIIDLGLGNREGSALLGSIRSVGMQADRVTIELRSLPQLKERLKRLQVLLVKLREAGQGSPSQWDRESVDSYYILLLGMGPRTGQPRPESLAEYLGPLFRLARARSANRDPASENRAALLALAIYLGDPRFEKLAGPVLSPELLGRSAFSRQVHLGGRQDLRLHFMVSAGLKLISDQGISSAIGEFKELLDAGRGGSGFSFVDLAADRAGIRFAEQAAGPDGGARRLQKLLAGSPAEELIFPSVSDLPEGLTREEFERLYGGIGKPGYDRMVREIDRRIDRCPAYDK